MGERMHLMHSGKAFFNVKLKCEYLRIPEILEPTSKRAGREFFPGSLNSKYKIPWIWKDVLKNLEPKETEMMLKWSLSNTYLVSQKKFKFYSNCKEIYIKKLPTVSKQVAVLSALSSVKCGYALIYAGDIFLYICGQS